MPRTWSFVLAPSTERERRRFFELMVGLVTMQKPGCRTTRSLVKTINIAYQMPSHPMRLLFVLYTGTKHIKVICIVLGAGNQK